MATFDVLQEQQQKLKERAYYVALWFRDISSEIANSEDPAIRAYRLWVAASAFYGESFLVNCDDYEELDQISKEFHFLKVVDPTAIVLMEMMENTCSIVNGSWVLFTMVSPLEDETIAFMVSFYKEIVSSPEKKERLQKFQSFCNF